jgi:hydrogenase nickel incorporation protein HypB
VNKIDYLFFSDFDVNAMKERVLSLNPTIKIFEISSKTGEGVQAWADWLTNEVKQFISQ